uniref:L-type lectin-like domain-containing protein n=2 Tax=Rhodosorus marinus TaxID=101924 RepID=A0A7S3EQZ9_9RHOD|mmetsp:Transcript_9747/g.41749  ORF Transcript_9747/g.41749 Transcript_9747/m.41749 type:complete len:532 (+) Transcript_9747:39-1634(+)
MGIFGRFVLVWSGLLMWLLVAVKGAEVFPTFTGGKGLGVFSFEAPFEDDESGPLRFWKFVGKSMVAADENSGADVLRITNPASSERGLAYSRIPYLSNEFEGYIDFKIKTPARKIPADGMTFFALNKPPQPGPVYGLEESFDGLVVAIDTFANSKKVRIPNVYPMYGDGTSRKWDAQTDGADRAMASGCFINLKFDDRLLFRVRGDAIYVAVGSVHSKGSRMCFTATGINFREGGGIYFGFSAETGHFFSEHLISKFHVKALSKYPDIDAQELQYEVEEEGLAEEEAYKDLFNFGMKRASSDDDYEAYDDDDYDDDEYDEDYDNYEDYEDYDEEEYDADHPHPPDLEDGNAQPDSGSKASTDQQQQHRQHHGHHHHGHHHGHGATNKHLQEVENNMNHLKMNMMHLLRKAAPEADELNDALHEIKEDIGMILEIVDETDLSFEDIDETAQDLPERANTLMKTVADIKAFVDRVRLKSIKRRCCFFRQSPNCRLSNSGLRFFRWKMISTMWRSRVRISTRSCIKLIQQSPGF